MASTVPIFGGFELYFFPSNSLLFVLFSSAVTAFVSLTQESFRHSFILKFQHSDQCPKEMVFLDVPSERSQSDASWYIRPESKVEVIHKSQNCLLKQRT